MAESYELHLPSRTLNGKQEDVISMFPGSFWDKFDPEDARVMTDEAVFSPDEFPNLPFCQPDKKYLLKLSMSVLFRHTETGVTRYVFLMLSPVIKYTLNNDGSRNYIDYK